MPLMIDGPDQLQEWLDWTWPRHNAFLACWKLTRNTEPECLSTALLAPLTEWCLLQCTTVLQEDYVRRSRIAGQKMCFSRNCFSLSKIPGQNFGAVSSAVAVYLCAHLWFTSLLSYPVSESALSIPQWKKIPHLHPEPQWMHLKKLHPAHLTRQRSLFDVSGHQSIIYPVQDYACICICIRAVYRIVVILCAKRKLFFHPQAYRLLVFNKMHVLFLLL